MPYLTDILPPRILSQEEIPALEQYTLSDVQNQSLQTLGIIHDAAALLRHLIYERDLFREAFIERNGKGHIVGIEKTKAAMNYLQRCAATQKN